MRHPLAMSNRLLTMDGIPVKIKEEIAAERECRAHLPKRTRKYYVAHYQHIGSRPNTFIGFACKSCNRWAEYGHYKNCPVEELEKCLKSP